VRASFALFCGHRRSDVSEKQKLSRRCVSYAETVDSSGVSSDFGSAVYGGCPATSKAKTARQTLKLKRNLQNPLSPLNLPSPQNPHSQRNLPNLPNLLNLQSRRK
jgi:hypothetical protein